MAAEDREDEEASRRTRMAGERTLLAWWRTGLAALAVAVGVGRLVPELSSGGKNWPYVLLGLGFAAYALALFVFGWARARQIDRALDEGTWSRGPDWATPVFAAGGVLLALAVVALIVTK